jgi:beta-glucosidase
VSPITSVSAPSTSARSPSRAASPRPPAPRRAARGGRLPFTIARDPAQYTVYATAPGPDGRLVYAEGTRVGHRHFDALALEPEFCFGHGLGYADFAYEEMTARDDDVTVAVRNVGTRAGKEVVQVYTDGRLAAFAAVVLAPGERASVTLPLDRRALRRWQDGGWVEPDADRLRAGRSSRDLRLEGVRIAGWDRSGISARCTASG